MGLSRSCGLGRALTGGVWVRRWRVFSARTHASPALSRGGGSGGGVERLEGELRRESWAEASSGSCPSALLIRPAARVAAPPWRVSASMPIPASMNDRTGLETLCRYGARGPLSLERLSWREDGKLA